MWFGIEGSLSRGGGEGAYILCVLIIAQWAKNHKVTLSPLGVYRERDGVRA